MKPDQTLCVTYLPVASLAPFATNARTHSKTQIRKIAESIRAFGFTNPVLIDKTDTIIAGHGRVEAAKLLGLEQVPTIRLESLTPAQIRAYVIADNRLAEDAGWDDQILKIELQNLILDGSIDVSCTGFETAEIDLIISEVPPEDESDDDLPATVGPPVSGPKDLWHLGPHRILCGDARAETVLAQLMGEKRADIVFTDPPYNVVIHGHATGNGKTHHMEFAMASGEMTEVEFREFLSASLSQLAAWSKNGSVHYVCMDWRHMSELLAAGKQAYDSLLNLCVWAKDNGGMGSFYRSQHELIFVFRNGKAQHRNNIQLGKFGRYRTNVWQYPGANTLSRSGTEGDLLSMHPTVKPISLAADALLDASARGEIVLDAFLGAGTTLLAAERVGRVCYGLEIEPKYVDLAIRRWQMLTGEHAILDGTTKTFSEVEEERSISHVG
jgi:DNA modification methylase